MKSWDEIAARRTYATDVGRTAANCLGELYNVLGNVADNGRERTVQRRDECLRVLESEMREMRTLQAEVTAAINARLSDQNTKL